jgi:hypothetical protein
MTSNFRNLKQHRLTTPYRLGKSAGWLRVLGQGFSLLPGVFARGWGPHFQAHVPRDSWLEASSSLGLLKKAPNMVASFLQNEQGRQTARERPQSEAIKGTRKCPSPTPSLLPQVVVTQMDPNTVRKETSQESESWEVGVTGDHAGGRPQRSMIKYIHPVGNVCPVYLVPTGRFSLNTQLEVLLAGHSHRSAFLEQLEEI